MASGKVLLTGGTGMIGFKVLTDLLEAGYQVRAAVRDDSGFERIQSLLPDSSKPSQIESTIVPDITAKGAYNEAVRGVKYVIHVASPLAHPKFQGSDYEETVIQPAIRGTLSMLEAAEKEKGIERAVITGSVLSLGAGVLNESSRGDYPQPPYENVINAYAAAKAQAFNMTEEWVASRKPTFDLVHILPTFVIGRDATVTKPQDIVRGTNGLIMGPFLGYAHAGPLMGSSVHLDDVAAMHVRSLDVSVPAGSYLASSHPPTGTDFGESFDIVRARYPEEVKDEVFKVDSTARPETTARSVDSSLAERTFGIKFKSFEEQVVSVADHFLELIGRKEAAASL